MADRSPWLSDLGMVNALGAHRDTVWKNLLEPIDPEGPVLGLSSADWGPAPVFRVGAELPILPDGVYDNRVNRLLALAVAQMEDTVAEARKMWGDDRIGVVIGSTDNGSEMAFESMSRYRENGRFPDGYTLDHQSAHNPAAFLKSHLHLQGPEIAVSTACSSSAVALSCARELISGGLCDAVIAGGADMVSQAVYLGFGALEAVSPSLCNPFSRRRNGITLGEGAAVFLVTGEPVGRESIRLMGTGESSDAHHMTAPHPEGIGAEAAMNAALADAGLVPENIHYLNLHGTGTDLNDSMEGRAVERALGSRTPCSSTKSRVGHTLGAAGATEAGICWMALREANRTGRLPAHRWDGEQDPDIPELRLVEESAEFGTLRYAMSNSFAFGGNNISIIIGRDG